MWSCRCPNPETLDANHAINATLAGTIRVEGAASEPIQGQIGIDEANVHLYRGRRLQDIPVYSARGRRR